MNKKEEINFLEECRRYLINPYDVKTEDLIEKEDDIDNNMEVKSYTDMDD